MGQALTPLGGKFEMERSLRLLLLLSFTLVATRGAYLLGACTQGCTNSYCNTIASEFGPVSRMYSVTVMGVTTQMQQALDTPGTFAQTNNGKFPLVDQKTALDVWSPPSNFTCDKKSLPQECTGAFNKVAPQKGLAQMNCTKPGS